jgi:hypothetical protein
VPSPVLNGGNLFIGAQPFAKFYFQGAIDEVLVYDRALSAADVRQIYNKMK